MKLTLTIENNEYIVRKDGQILTALVNYSESDAIKRFDEIVEACKNPKIILIKRAEIEPGMIQTQAK